METPISFQCFKKWNLLFTLGFFSLALWTHTFLLLSARATVHFVGLWPFKAWDPDLALVLLSSWAMSVTWPATLRGRTLLVLPCDDASERPKSRERWNKKWDVTPAGSAGWLLVLMPSVTMGHIPKKAAVHFLSNVSFLAASYLGELSETVPKS